MTRLARHESTVNSQQSIVLATNDWRLATTNSWKEFVC